MLGCLAETLPHFYQQVYVQHRAQVAGRPLADAPYQENDRPVNVPTTYCSKNDKRHEYIRFRELDKNYQQTYHQVLLNLQ